MDPRFREDRERERDLNYYPKSCASPIKTKSTTSNAIFIFMMIFSLFKAFQCSQQTMIVMRGHWA